MNTLTPAALADYFINNDLEIQVIRGDLAVLEECINKDFPKAKVTFGVLADAMELAMQDPYMQQMARYYDQDANQGANQGANQNSTMEATE